MKLQFEEGIYANFRALIILSGKGSVQRSGVGERKRVYLSNSAHTVTRTPTEPIREVDIRLREFRGLC